VADVPVSKRTDITDAVMLIVEATQRDERVRAQVEQLMEPLLDAVRVVADVWSRLPIEARMEIERMARSEEDAHNTSRRLAKEDDRE